MLFLLSHEEFDALTCQKQKIKIHFPLVFLSKLCHSIKYGYVFICMWWWEISETLIRKKRASKTRIKGKRQRWPPSFIFGLTSEWFNLNVQKMTWGTGSMTWEVRYKEFCRKREEKRIRESQRLTLKQSHKQGNKKWKWNSLSCVQLFATPWTIQSTGFSRPEYWSE